MSTPTSLTNVIENYEPYVLSNGGISTNKPVYINSDLTVTGTTNISGISLTDLTTTGNTILGNATSDTTLVNGVLTVTATAASVAITTNGGISSKTATAVPATAGAVAAGPAIGPLFTSGVSIWVTSDAPTHTATKGDLCINTGGSSSSTRLFINNGTTNWVAVTTAS